MNTGDDLSDHQVPIWIWILGILCTYGIYFFSLILWFVMTDLPFGGLAPTHNVLELISRWLFLFYPVVVLGNFALSIVSCVFHKGSLFSAALLFPAVYGGLWMLLDGKP